jgi:hypothetical protein
MGFDHRRLLKFEIQIGDPADIEDQIPGLTVVSQEGKTLTVLFATETALETFRMRLDQLEATGNTKYKQLLYNITSVDVWTAEDRRGRVLRREGLPEGTNVLLDIELWPLDLVPDRRAMVHKFREWCRTHGVDMLDMLDASTVVVFRVRAPTPALESLLAHRDVRLVDLPPRFGFDFKLLATSIDVLPEVRPPPASAPVVAVLDTGVAGNHPLIAPALKHAQSFTSGASAHDENGHGTHICGLAIYGDVERCAESKSFVPALRLLSGHRVAGGPRRASREVLHRDL